MLFRGGSGGYHSYRIPSIVRGRGHRLLAFAEGRRSSAADYGDINIVLRRSNDDGKTWSAITDVVGTSHGSWTNPTAVVDRDTDRVWLFLSYNDADHNQRGNDGYQPIDDWGERKVYSLYSDDDGRTWSRPVDRTATLVPRDHAWDAVGPGVGVQVTAGAHRGRLVIPAIGRNIISDDHGATWTSVELTDAAGRKLGGTSEAAIVELAGGGLYRNDRPSSTATKATHRRHVSVTDDDQQAWTRFQPDPTLLDPLCQASLLRYTGGADDRILFLNPSSTVARRAQRLRVSYDGGHTWPIDRTLPDGAGGYSSMAKTADYHVAALVEQRAPSSGAARSIALYRMNLPWILDGEREPR